MVASPYKYNNSVCSYCGTGEHRPTCPIFQLTEARRRIAELDELATQYHREKTDAAFEAQNNLDRAIAAEAKLEAMRDTTNFACETCGNPRTGDRCVHCQLAEAREQIDKPWPEIGSALVWVSFGGDDFPPFVFGAFGHVVVESIEEINGDLLNYADGGFFFLGKGDYLCSAFCDRGDESTAIPPHFELDVIDFRAAAQEGEDHGNNG